MPQIEPYFSFHLQFLLETMSSSSAPKKGESLIRQNFATAVEAGLNKQVGERVRYVSIHNFIFQISIELYASYVYLSMSYYFDRDDVALPNIAKWMKVS